METIRCKVPDCEANVRARGLCPKHYERLRVHGDVSRGRVATLGCSVEGCTRSHLAHGLCGTHLARLKSNGDPEKVRRVVDGIKSNPLWTTWTSIKQRCLNPNSRGYRNYGGRGIRMHEPWVNDSRGFIEWVESTLGPRQAGLTLDRIDNEGNYEPGNLRWADWSTQLRNRRPYRTTRSPLRDDAGAP